MIEYSCGQYVPYDGMGHIMRDILCAIYLASPKDIFLLFWIIALIFFIMGIYLGIGIGVARSKK